MSPKIICFLKNEKIRIQCSFLNDDLGPNKIVVIGSNTLNLGMVYNRTLPDGTLLDFTSVADQLPVVMSDTEGNRWDISGLAVSGPRSGQKLSHPKSYIGYWFAWGAFNPNLALYESSNNN